MLSKPIVKPRRSIKLTPETQRAIENALEILEAHYSVTLLAWPELTATQRDHVLQHSPLLARLARLTMWMGETWLP